MEVLSKSDYREAFSELFGLRKQSLGQKWTLSSLAKRVGLQASYLTNVVKGRAHFSADQIYAVCESLGLSDVETEYLVLLMELEKSAHAPRKAKLQSEIEELRRKHLSRYVQEEAAPLSADDLQAYYLDPNLELLHFYLGLKSKDQSPETVANALGISSEQVLEGIQFLSSRGLIKKHNSRWVRGVIKQHLSEDSSLCKPNQQLLRFKALNQLQNTAKERKYSFMATVSMDEDSRLKIQSAYLQFLKQARKIVEDAEPDEVYQIQFDLFPWF